jgi:hypothetical protein
VDGKGSLASAWRAIDRVPLQVAMGLIAASLATLLLAWLAPPHYRTQLDPAAIVPAGANAYSAPIPEPDGFSGMLFQLRHDQPGAPTASKLQLYEDGRPLGPPHADPARIGVRPGAFSHVDGRLLFWSSDATNPAANGRTYSAEAPLESRARLTVFLTAVLLLGIGRARAPVSAALSSFARRLSPNGALALLAFSVVLGSWVLLSSQSFSLGMLSLGLFALGAACLSISSPNRMKQVIDALFRGDWVARAPGWTALIWMGVGAAIAVAIHATMIFRLESTPQALASYFPVTDASGYWDCANQLINDGVTQTWCFRRPLYPVFLSGLSLLSGQNLEIVLILQAALVGALTLLFARQVARWLGLVASVLVCVTVALYAWTFVLGQTMSEVFGLSLCLLAGALLIRAAEARSVSQAILGVFLFTLGEFARPGALFAVPLLVLWVAFLPAGRLRHKLIAFALATLAAVAAYLANSGAVLAVGGDPALANANFVQTLYGLSVGKEWSSLGQDRPDLLVESREAVAEIYRLSFQNIAENPGVFMKSMADNLFAYLTNAWYLPLFGSGLATIVVLPVALLVTAVAARRSPRAALVLAIAVGELAAGALLTRDANVRVWAASGAIAQAVPLALLVVAIAQASISWFRTEEPVGQGAPAPSLGWPVTTVVAAGLAGILSLVPLVSAKLRLQSPESSQASLCDAGLRQVAFSPRASAWMTIQSRLEAGQSPPRFVDRARLLAGVPPGLWYRPSVAALPDVQLFRALAMEPGLDPGTPLYAPVDLPIPQTDRLVVCVDDQDQIELAAAPFTRIVSVVSQAN